MIKMIRVNGNCSRLSSGSRLRTELHSLCRAKGASGLAGKSSRRFLGGRPTQPHSIRYPSRARPASCQHLTTLSILHTRLRLTSTPTIVASVSAPYTHPATCLPNRLSSSSGATSTRLRPESMSSRASTASPTLAPSPPSMACA
jgi:hypothetical protein